MLLNISIHYYRVYLYIVQSINELCKFNSWQNELWNNMMNIKFNELILIVYIVVALYNILVYPYVYSYSYLTI